MAATDRREAAVIPAQAGIQRRSVSESPVIPAQAGIQRRSDDNDTGLLPAQERRSVALLAAALALPGVVAGPAHAQTAPDQGVIGFRYFDYRDWQPGAERMTVRSPSLYALKPLSDSLSLEGSLVYDAMSGASPLYFNTLSGASGLGITDYRTAGDAKLTKYFDRWAIGVGGAVSSERDYLSRSLSVDVRTWTADKNRTYAFGIAGTKDDINSATFVAEGKHKETYDFLVGVTQNLNAGALIQSNLTYSDGRGYYDDPYKLFDRRPGARRVWAWLTRYNQYVQRFDATLRLSYRYISDSWHADSHTFEVQWVQPLPQQFTLTPGCATSARTTRFSFTARRSARAWCRASPTARTRGSPRSAASRRACACRSSSRAAGARTWRMSFYRQKGSWHFGGDDTPGLLDFSARWYELGVQKTF